MTTKTISLILASAALALAVSAGAADFPDKPIRIIVPFAAGTATDQLARALGQAMTAESKAQVIVDNKPGAFAKHPVCKCRIIGNDDGDERQAAETDEAASG